MCKIGLSAFSILLWWNETTLVGRRVGECWEGKLKFSCFRRSYKNSFCHCNFNIKNRTKCSRWFLSLFSPHRRQQNFFFNKIVFEQNIRCDIAQLEVPQENFFMVQIIIFIQRWKLLIFKFLFLPSKKFLKVLLKNAIYKKLFLSLLWIITQYSRTLINLSQYPEVNDMLYSRLSGKFINKLRFK
jgi:hypothetical protein